MSDISTNNKSIAKNTLILYLRMFFLMLISLFTSRLVLQTLGVVNYGIYNAVGGIVSMFALLSGSLTNSVMRYLTIELGRNDSEKLKKVFSTSINVMLILGGVILILGETIGLWFLNAKMNIPEGRMIAANWVYQCSLATFVINLLSIPYNASIISHERMGVFAYISILEAVLKILLVCLLFFIDCDKLILYAILMLMVASTIRLVYGLYCKRKFPECIYKKVHDRALIKGMTSFAGWNFFGQGANVICGQGINIMMNIFFGVTVNAARGVAMQVKGTVYSFITNFTVALNPQITKSYASGDFDYMHSLIYRGAKLSYFLMLFLILPLCYEAESILQLWLGIVPDYAVLFVRLTLIESIINVVNETIVKGLHATGNIKKYMLIVGIVEFSIFPLTFIAFKIGLPVEVAYAISISIYIILMFLRVVLIKNQIGMTFREYAKEVYYRIFMVTLLAIIAPTGLCYMLSPSIMRLVVLLIVATVCTALAVFYGGLTTAERNKIVSIVEKKIIKKHTKE